MELKKYLENKHKSQFAASVGCKYSMLHKIMKYGRIPSVTLARSIETATGGKVSAIELLGLNKKRAA